MATDAPQRPLKPLTSADPPAVAAYRLLGLLGAGGMGRVYLGQSRSGRKVAIKVIRAELAEDRTFRLRFAREVAAARAVSPLYTAAVVDADPDADLPWLATTFIDGPSLEELVTTQGPLPPGAVLTLAAGLAEALASIHGVGLVHRDLKPSNILVDDSGPHIIDFGIALAVDVTRMTTSLVVGTPSFMAPERIHGRDDGDGGKPGDVFSLGATLAFAATGKNLVSEGTMYAQVVQMTLGRFDLSALPRQLRPMVVRCVSRRPEDRPTAEELSRILAGSAVAPPGPGWLAAETPAQVVNLAAPRRVVVRRRVLLGLGVALGAAAISGGYGLTTGLLTWSWRQPGEILWQVRTGIRPPAGAEGQPPVPPGTTPGATPSALPGATPSALPGATPSGLPGDPAGGDPSTRSQATGADQRPPGGARIVVDAGRRIIATDGREVFALDPTGKRLWAQRLSTEPMRLYPWDGSVLVTDDRRVWRLDAATGTVRFTANAAQDEEALHSGDNPDALPVRVRGVALSPSLAFLSLGTALVALDGANGTQRWRTPRPADADGGRQSLGEPTAAGPDWLLTQEVVGDTGQAGLYDATTGKNLWRRAYVLGPAPPGRSPNQPPQGPADRSPERGGPPREGQGPKGGPPNADDELFNRSEGRLVDAALVLRDRNEIRMLAAADAREHWHTKSDRPAVALEVAGDRVLLGADVIIFFDAATGTWLRQDGMRGARLAPVPHRFAVAATEQNFAELDSGGVRWKITWPSSIQQATPDTVTVHDDVAYVTFRPRPDRRDPLDVDVIAISLAS